MFFDTLFSPNEIIVLKNSIKVGLLCATFSAPIAIFFGWLLARKEFRGKVLLGAFLQLSLVLPPVVVGYVLLILLSTKGLIGQYLFSMFGIRLTFNFTAAVIASIAVALPLFIRSARLAIEMIDVRYEHAARTLGKTPLQIFFLITLPLAVPGIISGFILSFSRSLGEFGATMILAGNIPGETQTIPLAVYSFMQSPYGEASAMKLIFCSIAISIVFFAISEMLAKYSLKGVKNRT